MLTRLIKKLYLSAVKHKTARYKKLWLLALRYSLRHKNTSVIRQAAVLNKALKKQKRKALKRKVTLLLNMLLGFFIFFSVASQFN